MEETGTIANVAKATRQELMDGYRALLKKYKDAPIAHGAESPRDTPAREKVSKYESETAIGSAINATRSALQAALSEIDRSIGEKFAELKAFDEAIAAQKVKLKESYELEQTAGALIALLQAKEEAKRQADNEKTEYDQKRKREEEEYRFTFDLQKRKDKELYEAEKRKLEAELEVKRADFEKQQQHLAAREAEFEGLKKEVEGFSARMEEEKQRLEARLTAESSKQKETELLIARKEAEAQKIVYEERIRSAEAAVEECKRLIAHLHEQLKVSQTQAQEVVLKSIEGASGIKTLDAVNKLALEQTRAASGRSS